MVGRRAMREIIRDIKVGRFSTIATLAGVVLLTVAGGWWLVHSRFEPSPTAQVDALPEIPAPTSLAQIQPAAAIAQKNITAAKSDSTAIAAVQGLLRVGNPTGHPVRVAVLLKKPSAKDSADQSQTGYEAPAHWDFDPGEGSEKACCCRYPIAKSNSKRRYFGCFCPRWLSSLLGALCRR